MTAANVAQGAATGPRRASVYAAILIVVLLLVVTIAPPAVRHWRLVEAPLRTASAQVATLQALIANRGTIDAAVDRSEQQLGEQSQRVLRARSRSLAASALQSLVLELAESSNVTVTRLDVAAADSTGDLPVDLSANGDIYGLTELLQRLRSARFVMTVRRLQVQNNSALRGAPDVLQIALSLQAPVIVP